MEIIPKKAVTTVRNHSRCAPCAEERLDGKPCNTNTCLCCCHRVSRKEVEIRRLTRIIRSTPGMGDWTIPQSFDEEVAAGKFGEMKPILALTGQNKE